MKELKILEALYSNTLGGSEMLGLALANEFVARGHDCDILTVFTGDGSFVADLDASGRNVYEAGFHGRHLSRRLTVPLYLYRLFKQQAYDAIHCHHMAVFFHCLLPARLAGIPRIVVTEHAHQHFAGNDKLTRRSKRLGPKADCVTVIHRELERFFGEELGIPADRLRFIANGVDTNVFSPAPAPAELQDRIDAHGWTHTIGCVSRMHPDKDIPNLLRAFRATIEQSSGRPGLIVVGDGQERPVVESLIAEAGIGDQVLLAGVQTNINEWMRVFDLFVLPSRREGVPLAILEALSAGLPIVATRVGGVPDIVDESVGRLVEPEDPDNLGRTLADMIADPDRLERMSTQARRTALERYSFSNMVDRYLDALGVAIDP